MVSHLVLQGHSGDTQSTNWSLERSKTCGLVSEVLTDFLFVISVGKEWEVTSEGLILLPAFWKVTAFGFAAATDAWQHSN